MWRVILSVVFACCLLPSEATAQRCNFTVSDVVFTNVDTLSGGAIDATGQVVVNCTTGLLTDVRACLNINAGSGGATSGVRHMRHVGSNSPLDFQLYRDPGRTVPWGSRTSPGLGQPVTVTFLDLLPSGRTETVPIYARIFGGQQGAPAGVYQSIFSGAEIEFNYRSFLLIPLVPCSSISTNTTRVPLVVRADVPNNCRVAAEDINFGSHGVLRDPIDATGAIEVSCTQGTSYHIGLGNGLQGEGPTRRRMALGGNT